MPNNTVCHIEFPVTDFTRSKRFYEGLFAWNFREFGPMMVFGTDDGHIGGFIKADRVEPAAQVQVYFSVADLDALVAKASGLGGSLVREKHEVPEVGWSAEVADPDGNPIGLVQFFEDGS
jgi:predicted enzyme related to lactoylglutathione lyase